MWDRPAAIAETLPGRENGSITEKIAKSVSELIHQADYLIDLHTGGALFDLMPLTGYLLHPDKDVLAKQKAMAKAFNLPLIWGTDATAQGRTLSIARDNNIPAIYAECRRGASCKNIYYQALYLCQHARLDAIEDLLEARPGDRDAVVPEPDDRVVRIVVGSNELGDASGQLLRPARVVDIRSLDPVHPGVNMDDRADAGMLGRSSSARLRRPRRGAAPPRAGRSAPSARSRRRSPQRAGCRGRGCRAGSCRRRSRSSRTGRRPSVPRGCRTRGHRCRTAASRGEALARSGDLRSGTGWAEG